MQRNELCPWLLLKQLSTSKGMRTGTCSLVLALSGGKSSTDGSVLRLGPDRRPRINGSNRQRLT